MQQEGNLKFCGCLATDLIPNDGIGLAGIQERGHAWRQCAPRKRMDLILIDGFAKALNFGLIGERAFNLNLGVGEYGGVEFPVTDIDRADAQG